MLNDDGNENEIDVLESRIMYGGKYLIKNSGSFYERSLHAVRDFSTLLRNLIIYKLTNFCDFLTRSFLSEDTKYIYLVLYTSY
jgi:hypothetical protein